MAKTKLPNSPAAQRIADSIEERATLLDVALTELSAVQRVEDRSNLPKLFETRVQTKITQDCDPDADDPFKHKIVAELTMAVDGKYDQKDAKSVIRIAPTFRAIYGLSPGRKLTQKQLLTFASLSVLPLIWPYFREIVQNTSVRMALPPLRIPVCKRRQIIIEHLEQH